MSPCIYIPIIVGLLCALLGYLLGRLFRGSNDTNNDDSIIIELKNKISQLETNLEACNKAKLTLQNDLDACQQSKLGLASDLKLAREASSKSSVSDLGIASNLTDTSSVTLLPFDSDAAKAVFGKKIKQDDLKIVEGIGPKIEGLFHSFDIKTWKALSETSIEKCQEVLNSGGERYRIHKPDTWPQQAKLAYEGKWKELLKWQDELDGGKA